MTVAIDTVDNKFPFAIEDLKAWIVRRKDGTLIKYTVREGGGGPKLVGSSSTASAKVSLSAWCKHDAAPLPTFEVGNLELRIADSTGAKSAWAKGSEDLIIDAGDVLSAWAASPILTGTAQDLIDHLRPWCNEGTEVLKIHWDDRMAPNLHPQFWIEMGELLRKKAAEYEVPYRVLINCMGGHGRSGTGLVCLMMYLSDYSALDAMTHIRAVHCPRAIESVVQHEYIDMFASYLGRDVNAKEAHQVKNFKERFLSLTCETSKPYRERLEKKEDK